MTTNGFQLNTLNVGGSRGVVLESSRDLMTWTPIQTNATATAQQFVDPSALTQTQQFTACGNCKHSNMNLKNSRHFGRGTPVPNQ